MFRRPMAVLSLVLIAAACSSHPTGRIDDARLVAADADTAKWLSYGRTYDEQRYSPLTQVNDANVAELGLVWSREYPTSRGMEATPLVVDGTIYTTASWSVVYAYDAATGEQLWTYDPKVDRTRTRTVCCDVVNRGLALYRGHVFVGTLDGRLISLDARTGAPAWDVMTIDPAKPFAITGAPRVAKGRVLIGNAGAEYGVRGYISAYDAATGALVWRVYSVPGDPSLPFESRALEAAAKTWSGDKWLATGGGGTTWDPIVYDPELDQVYFGTGNGTAWYRDLRATGDNLYLASILAVRASDGEYVWHYQVTPGDNWDYDATQPLMQATLTIGGAPRKVVMQASKNGFFYVIDRTNGQFISATPFVDGITWATGIDSVTGRPIESPTAYAGLDPVVVSPDPEGAHNWYPMAMDPARGLVFLGARSFATTFHAPDKEWTYNPSGLNVGYDPRYEGEMVTRANEAPAPVGELVAWNPVERRAAWRVKLPVSQSGGVLATAGNLVLQGSADGMLSAYHAADGRRLWQFDAGTGVMAPPVTYLVGDKQYLTVMVGWGGAQGLFNPSNMGPVKPGFSRILTFALGGTATLAPTPYGHTEPPTPAASVAMTPAEVNEGRLLYEDNCIGCHGAGAIAGPVPDLRYMTAEVYGQMEAIVLGGARQQLGMPSFSGRLDQQQLRLIQGYIMAQAELAASRGAKP
ncbi:MAG: PQQ-dependent dehydrogenase, methanol/ethanol family [Gemmatimonadota bacterium]|nr:PQQ-dependent dehydrogenase, methanol/ethanol family [Gemmatimonadota bacterium]